MLDRLGPVNSYVPEYVPEQGAGNDILNIIEFLFRNKWIIVGSFLVALALSSAYILIAPVRYTATAQMILDPDKGNIGQPEGRGEGPVDTATVESQIVILKAERIAQAVVNDLHLDQDEEFVPSKPGIKQTILTMLSGTSPPLNAEERTQVALERLQKSLEVKRVGVSYVIDVAFSSKGKHKSALIANAVAQAYLQTQADMRNDTIQAADKWLEDRLSVIRSETIAAENAVQEFKAQTKNAASGAVLVDLESYARLKRNLYETYMQRHMEITQRESSPAVVARVLSRANPPLERSEPRTFLVFGIGAALGLALGSAIAFIIECIAKYRESRGGY
ncbi:hypothetical protein ILT44_28575 [Microvirga sp. BT689]|uniref:GumC family protein n=1 Tax=Microvirga arvi TaxID=2778731 RepID=UPI00194FC504|nr:Wzz/FepE/Etk N-terminal domain-containing protein [Microvirga arvi]MBM6584155.1 hypothetical protein [Microvirga arvi]